MRLQILLREESDIDEKLGFLRDWEELSYKLERKPYGECSLFFLDVPNEEFKKLLGIFSNIQEAMGAFLSVAMEHGWEDVPNSYILYHAQFENGKLITALKDEQGIHRYEQTTIEEMTKKISHYPRVVALSYDVVTYIKDIYPDIDFKLYLISKELTKLGKPIPNIEGRGIEEVLDMMENLLNGESLPPVSKPVMDC